MQDDKQVATATLEKAFQMVLAITNRPTANIAVERLRDRLEDIDKIARMALQRT
jgi:hypothetical protein